MEPSIWFLAAMDHKTLLHDCDMAATTIKRGYCVFPGIKEIYMAVFRLLFLTTRTTRHRA